jgi:hypothetical protein
MVGWYSYILEWTKIMIIIVNFFFLNKNNKWIKVKSNYVRLNKDFQHDKLFFVVEIVGGS